MTGSYLARAGAKFSTEVAIYLKNYRAAVEEEMERLPPRPVHGGSFQLDINIDLSILRILCSLIVNLEVRLVRALEFAFLFKLEDVLPGIGNDFCEGADFGCEHRIFSRRNVLQNQSIWRGSSILNR